MEIKEHKKIWDNLAKDQNTESKYIYTDGDIDFRDSGFRDYQKLIKEDIYIKQFLDPMINKTALEIGCGTGRMTEFIARDFKKVYAIDISPTIIIKGQERLKDILNIEWIETDGIHLIKGIKVDFIFSYTVFQHCTLEMIIANLKDIKELLSNSGIMKIQVRGREIRQDKWYSGCWFTPEEIKELLEKLGFEVVDIWHNPKERRYLWAWAIL